MALREGPGWLRGRELVQGRPHPIPCTKQTTYAQPLGSVAVPRQGWLLAVPTRNGLCVDPTTSTTTTTTGFWEQWAQGEPQVGPRPRHGGPPTALAVTPPPLPDVTQPGTLSRGGRTSAECPRVCGVPDKWSQWEGWPGLWVPSFPSVGLSLPATVERRHL